MSAIYKRELASYYHGYIGYLFAVPLLVMAGIYCWVYNLIEGFARFEYTTASLPFILIFLVPVLTMRVMSEERREHTDQLLYSLPTTSAKVVLGKFFAMLTVFAVPMGVLALYPLLLSRFGTINMAMAYGNLLALFLLGASLIAVGQYLSSLTDNPAVALALCLLVMLVNYFLSPLAVLVGESASLSLAVLLALALLLGVIAWFFTRSILVSSVLAALLLIALTLSYLLEPSSFIGVLSSVMKALCLFTRQEAFQSGLFDLTALVYYLAVIGVFLFFTVQSMEKRRWNG